MRAPIRRGTAQRLGLILPAIGHYLAQHPGVTWPPHGPRPAGLIEHVEPITDQEFADLKARWQADHGVTIQRGRTDPNGHVEPTTVTLDNTGATWTPSDRNYWPMPYEHYPADNTTQTDEVSDPTGRYRKRRWWRP